MQFTYQVRAEWQHQSDQPFNDKSFDRTHTIHFNGGSSIQASSAPEYLGNKALPNPEELFTSSIASCFILTFIFLAARKGLVIDHVDLQATSTLAKNDDGKMAMTELVLKPTVTFQADNTPEPSLLHELYKKAHDNCFISSSVKTAIKIEA